MRRVQRGYTWHSATDQLVGTDVYGTPGSGSFSIRFDHLNFNQFLFSTGDCQKWLIATKDAVLGGFYANEPRAILKSSISATPYTARWYRRSSSLEDPWISLTDHAQAIDAGLEGLGLTDEGLQVQAGAALSGRQVQLGLG